MKIKYLVKDIGIYPIKPGHKSWDDEEAAIFDEFEDALNFVIRTVHERCEDLEKQVEKLKKK